MNRISRLIVFVLIFCSFNKLIGYQSSSRSFRDLRAKSIDILQPSVELIASEDYSNAKVMLDSIYTLALVKEDSFLLSGTLSNLGFLNYRLGNFNESIIHYKKSLNLDLELGDSANASANLKSLGICYRQKGQFERAISFYLKALDLIYDMGANREKASILNSVGNLYNELDDFQQAYNNFSNALEIWSSLKDSIKSSYVLSNMGNALLGLDKVDEAINAYNESLELKFIVGSKSSIAITLSNLGEAYFKKNDIEQARRYYLESLSLREESGQKNRVATVSHNLAWVELESGNYIKAQSWLLKALKIIKITESQDEKLENLRIQKKLFEKTGELKKAIKTDSAYDHLKQIVFDEQVVNVQKLQYEFDLERKDQERENIQTRLDLVAEQYRNRRFQSQIQQIVIIAAIIAILIVGYFAYTLRKKNRHIENLIRELHHRVKNHLGMISGMFGAQTGLSMADTAVLDEAKTRVEAVNGIHRRLYRQDEYEYVNMKEYLEELVDNNALVFGLFNRIEKHFEIHEQIMDIDKAISVGLIANEVLTNAFKYGLQNTREPKLKIVLEKAIKGYKMVIFNNAESDNSTGGGFGGELISRLAQNLKGQIQIIKQGGFQFELTFP